LGSYLVRRFFLMLLTLFGISVLVFVMLRLVPGNIADILFDAAGMIDVSEKGKLEHELGLDKPIVVQYLNWIGGLAHGDLGYSYVSEKPALDEIAPRIPITAKLAGLALAFSVLFGVPLGVISAVRQNTPLDYILRVVSLSGLSMPSFWLGLLILMAFVAYSGTLPIYTDPPIGFWETVWLYSVPAAAVGFRSSALVMRLTRSSMLEVLRQDYIRTARAKGASDRNVNYHHALRNALLPVVTVIGIEAAFLMGGLIVTETVFNIPGVARFLVGLSDRAEPGDVHRGGGGVGELPDRSALRGARSAHPLRELIHDDHRHHPGTGGRDRPRRHRMVENPPPRDVASARGDRRRHHAGVRVRRDFRRSDHQLQPDADQFGDLAAAARPRPRARRRSDGARHIQPHRLRRAHFARGRHRLDRARQRVRRRAGAGLRLYRRLG